jgi:hypothetical protein
MPRLKKEDKQASKIKELEYELNDTRSELRKKAVIVSGLCSLFNRCEDRDLLARVVEMISNKNWLEGKNSALAETIHVLNRNLRVALNDTTLELQYKADPTKIDF